MFYSVSLLSKKGPLGTVWTAAHCLERLKKHQFKRTDISSSVDRILRHEIEVFTYRTLAYLLFGVVRIFSKKVEFLFHDCHDVLRNLNDFGGGKRACESIEAMPEVYHSITLPQRFELDAFDLGTLIDDQEVSSSNVRAPEEILLPDTLEGNHRLNDKYYYCGDNSFEAYSSMYTPVKDVFSYRPVDIDLDTTSSHDMHKLESRLEKLHEIRFPLEDRLEPLIFCESEKGSGVDVPFNEEHQIDGEQIENSADARKPEDIFKPFDKEKLHGISFPLEEALESRIFSDKAKESQTDHDQMSNFDSGINVAGPENFDKDQIVESEEMRFPEMTSLSNQIITKRPMSITIDSNFHSGSEPDAVSPEFMAVRTPATKERARVPKKRKCVLDDTIVLSNKLIKHAIDYSGDLVCKRRKVPHAFFHAWKAQKISNVNQSFLEPLIPWNSIAFRSLVPQKKFTSRKPVETTEISENEVTDEVPINQICVESPIKDRCEERSSIAPATPVTHSTLLCVESPVKERCEERSPIAPTTPVTHSTLLRFHEVQGAFAPDISETASSFESIKKQTTPNEDEGLNVSLMDEEMNSSAGDTNGKKNCSVRARKVGRYLYEKFADQRRQNGSMFINLTQILKGKSRKENARLFYEILVLKTGDYIDVTQENAFGDILVLETPEMKNSLD